MMAKRLFANRPARVWELVGLVGLRSGGFITVNLAIGLARLRQTKYRKYDSRRSKGLLVARAATALGQRNNRMRGSITLATLLLGLAPAWAAAGTAAAAPQAARSERQPASASTPPAATAQTSDSDADDDQDGERKPRRPQRAEPASPASPPPAPQPIFIISCNASGCNDNQGRFLTRSGPQRLVGPDGISCQQMGGNWQCSP